MKLDPTTRDTTRLLPLPKLNHEHQPKHLDVNYTARHGRHAEDTEPAILIVAWVWDTRSPHPTNTAYTSSSAASIQANNPKRTPDEPPPSDTTTARIQNLHQEAQSHPQFIGVAITGDVHWKALRIKMAGGGHRRESVGGDCEAVEGRVGACHRR